MIFETALEVTNDSSLVPIIRRIAIHPLKEMGVIDEDVDRVATIISEGCSNVVKYAYTDRSTYTVHLQYFADRMIIAITDSGKGYDRTSVKEPVPGQIGGYGLSLIVKSADSVDIESYPGCGTAVVTETLIRYQSDDFKRKAYKLDGGVI